MRFSSFSDRPDLVPVLADAGVSLTHGTADAVTIGILEGHKMRVMLDTSIPFSERMMKLYQIDETIAFLKRMIQERTYGYLPKPIPEYKPEWA